jgi:hypothetical protein
MMAIFGSFLYKKEKQPQELFLKNVKGYYLD